ncbi:hypothetical protein HW555_007945 [Spodoptera exigua]|uniref:Uncharacterized protein n=1 Tax=Spodoptera exigua TaxID=7107 RepID=A0A835GEZ1_SPOEX|nr:hypothetical protein HW555_007945 [Spodoptera exigua]
MRRACAIILFLVFTQYLIETSQAMPDPQYGSAGSSCGSHGTACTSDSDCCENSTCHRYAKKCQIKLNLPKRYD